MLQVQFAEEVAFGGAGATGMVTCGPWVARELDSFGVVWTELGGCRCGVLARAIGVFVGCARKHGSNTHFLWVFS